MSGQPVRAEARKEHRVGQVPLARVTGLATMLLSRQWPPRHWSRDDSARKSTRTGFQIAVRRLDSSGSPPGAGALFGLAVKPSHRAVYFVDDATNTFGLLH